MVAVHTLPTPHEAPAGSPAGRPPRRPSPLGDRGRPAAGARRSRPGRALPDRATRLRRRRLAALSVAVASLGAGSLVVQEVASLTRAGATEGPQPLEIGPEPVAGGRYVVRPGDTLWSIALEIAPGSDPRPVVHALRAANGDVALEVGQVLTLEIE
jgi:nucleoid-associated protein YgaU